MKDAKGITQRVFDAAGVTIGGAAPQDITVHDDRFYPRLVADRTLGLGESYMDGWWDAQCVDLFLSHLIAADTSAAMRPSPALAAAAAQAKFQNRQNVTRSSSNVQSHYDIGNDLYEAMLDKRMIYSCGYWVDALDLEVAQEAKLDLVCRKLGIEPGMTVLDIGCGWGGFACYAAERYGAKVVGISLAVEQVKLARERTNHLDVEIRLQDYRTMTGSFDRIVSIGMFEHVGPKNYRAFFESCDRLLKPDGVMLHHTIGGLESKTRTDPWFDKYIFPGGVMPSMAQIGRASERDWVIEDVHNFGVDYDTTLMAWHANISQAWKDLPQYDRRFRRMWNYYLLASAAGFRTRNSQLWQIVFRRPRRAALRFETIR